MAARRYRPATAHVEAFVAAGKLTAEQGAALVDEAEQVLAALDCQA